MSIRDGAKRVLAMAMAPPNDGKFSKTPLYYVEKCRKKI
jgi:hypothetical protein